MYLGRRLLVLACSAAIGLSSPHARADDGPLVLSRARALELGAERGPGVREASAPLRELGAVQDAASAPLAYAPRVNAFAGRRVGAFGSGPEVGASLTQDVSLHGLGDRRREMAVAIARATRTEVERARLEGAALAVLAWIDLLAAQETLRVRTAARKDAEEIARVARARADRGVAAPAEATLAAAEVGTAELSELEAEGRLFDARTGLRFAVGAPPSADVAVVGEIHPRDDGPPAPRPSREHPADTAARARVELARADAKLARAASAPALGVGVAFSREGQGEQLASGTVSLPLPFLDPTRFEAARHQTLIASAEGKADRIRSEIARDVAIAEHERLHSREVRDSLASKVLVPLRETVRLARAAFQAGTQDVTVFLLLRQRLVAADEQLGRAAAEVYRADLRYELARGTLLDEVKR